MESLLQRQSCNVAVRLARSAAALGNEVAIATPRGSFRQGTSRSYATISFSDLESRTSSIAAGLQSIGIRPGHRIAMLVPFGEDFLSLVFAILKTGATIVLIDPGMGRRNLIRCLEAVSPDGFVAIPQAHVIRAILASRFPKATLNVMVGNDFGLSRIPNLKRLEANGPRSWVPPETAMSDEAAIIYTTGSTGPPKGVRYTHETFNSQIDQLVEGYSIVPGGRDLSGFPLFGLFNAVMGTTTIIPDMDPTRPADVDPTRLLDAIDQWEINQAFGSPALWTKVGRHCDRSGRRVPSLMRILSAGAPVAPRVLSWIRKAAHENAMVYTPYGATEALPVASIESREVLGETANAYCAGRGTCVGRRFSGIEWRVIAIDDGPLSTLKETRTLSYGQIGELMVKGAVVTKSYVTRTDQNAFHKVSDGDTLWHRMGDVGYLDEQDRFWYCGRKSHRVQMSNQVLFTEPCEAIYNNHPAVHRAALVGTGQPPDQRPTIVIEPWPERTPRDRAAKESLVDELQTLGEQNPGTASIRQIAIYPGRLPTDIRHNAKIFREKLVPWVEKNIRGS